MRKKEFNIARFKFDGSYFFSWCRCRVSGGNGLEKQEKAMKKENKKKKNFTRLTNMTLAFSLAWCIFLVLSILIKKINGMVINIDFIEFCV